MYGKSTPTAIDAPEIIIIHKMLKRFQALMRPGFSFIERFPILKYVPGFTSELEAWRKEECQLFHTQLDRVSKEIVSLFWKYAYLFPSPDWFFVGNWRCWTLVL
jgi:hypothetical protein